MTSRSSACTPLAGTEGLEQLIDDAHDLFVRNLRFWFTHRLGGEEGGRRIVLQRDPALKPADLARHLGKHQSAISNWFKGLTGPEIGTIGRVAEFLGVPPYELFAPDVNEPTPITSRPPRETLEEAVQTFAETFGYDAKLTPKRKR